MDEDEAIRKAVKAFYDGANFTEYEKAKGSPIKYSKGKFDEYEKELKKSVGKGKKMEEVDNAEIQ